MFLIMATGVSSGASCIRVKRCDKGNPEGKKLQYFAGTSFWV